MLADFRLPLTWLAQSDRVGIRAGRAVPRTGRLRHGMQILDDGGSP
jgi:hypothetical protein